MRRFAFIGAVLAGAMNGGCGAPPEERAIPTFTDGDLKTVRFQDGMVATLDNTEYRYESGTWRQISTARFAA